MPTPDRDLERPASGALNASARAILDSAPDAAVVISASGRILHANPRAASLLGCDIAAGAAIWDLVGDDGGALRTLIQTATVTPETTVIRPVVIRPARGQARRFVAVAYNGERDPGIGGVVLHLRPPHADDSASAEERPPSRDPLTSLPGRAAIVDLLLAADTGAGHVGALVLDLDRFADFVESHGFAVGDRALVVVAERLLTATRGVGALVRFGDSAFAVVVARVTPPQLESVATALLREIRRPVTIDDRELWLTASVGMAIGVARPPHPEAIVHQAAQALAIAKTNGGDRAVWHDPSATATAAARRVMAQELRRAIDRQEFEIHYQPIIDLATGQVCELEALARWRRPAHGLLVASDFIPVAEECGIVRAIDRHVMDLACQEFTRFGRTGRLSPAMRLALNVSARQLQEPHFVDDVREALADARLAPERLRVEITESFVIQNIDRALQAIDALRGMGVSFALDDFGTGYSSLAYLARIPAAAVKIDKSFVRHIASDPSAVTLVRAMISLAHAFGMHTTAEGIEDDAQLAALRALRCDRGQGYLFA
ncbi:MAG: sensor domain-containing phosphodiesterase, partial [Dehalococcoidia bacterium]|nr:sensor domain-containing phosphodiesterase [Dehalococcoidia bacterium]